MDIASIGIDLGKTGFHLVVLDERGKIAYTANLQPALASKPAPGHISSVRLCGIRAMTSG
jgi:hypothetical protein